MATAARSKKSASSSRSRANASARSRPRRCARCATRRGCASFEEALKLAQPRRVAHLAQRLGLDLADAFARDLELLADFFERAAVAIPKAEAQFEHLAFAVGQRGEHVAQLLLQQAV